jgi:cytochrome c-type biogenesis protein CcmH/NrfG
VSTNVPRRLALGIALVASIPYLNGLKNGFAFDDVVLAAENPRIRSIEGIGRTLTTDWWAGATSRTLVYRPLALITLSADYAAARLGEAGPPPQRLPDRAAFPFHLQNVFWHAAASVALYLLVIEMFSVPALAFLTAALFAVHPVHTEAVYGIVGRAELLSAFLVFSCLIVSWRVVRDNPAGIGRPALAGVLLGLAALSKEYAIVVPAVPVIWLFLRSPGERRAIAERRSFRLLMTSLVAAVLVFLALRAAVLGSITGVGDAPANLNDPNNPIATAEGPARWLTPVRVFGEVARLIVYPRTLSADYSFRQIPLVSSLDLPTIVCLLALIGLAAAAIVLRRRSPAASFGILFFFLTWALTSNFIVPIGTILGERILYLPSAGICLAVAGSLVAAGKRFRVPVAVATTAFLVLGAARTWARGADWKDNLTLFESAAKASPLSCKVHYNLAVELRLAGRTREAADHLERALQLGPNDAKIHNNLAGILAGEGKLDAAIVHLEQAVRIDPNDADAQYNLGSLLRQVGRAAEAIGHFEAALRLRPEDADAAAHLEEAQEASRRRP